jgi:hypothetical protein
VFWAALSVEVVIAPAAATLAPIAATNSRRDVPMSFPITTSRSQKFQLKQYGTPDCR